MPPNLLIIHVDLPQKIESYRSIGDIYVAGSMLDMSIPPCCKAAPYGRLRRYVSSTVTLRAEGEVAEKEGVGVEGRGGR